MARPRKTEIDADIQAKIFAAIKLGSTYELAAQYAGISYRTLRNWITRAEAEEEGFIHFLQALKEAEGAGAFKLLTKINTAADDGSWQAAAWILERRYPNEYGKQRIEHSGVDGGPLQIKLVREVGFNPAPDIQESDE
jgi:transposase